MADEARFKCLRCGHEFIDSYSSDVVVERSCPGCRSNSVRRIKTTSKDHSKNPTLETDHLRFRIKGT